MTDSVSRYYESMGRGKGAPYMDEKYNYAQTEPDLTEAVNKNIDEQIKDTQAFFKANIENFNASIKVRDKAFKDAVSLTKSGLRMVERYNKFKDNRNYLKNIDDKGSDDEYMTKWNAADIDFQKKSAEIEKDFQIEIGAATKSINETGSYTFQGPDGEVTIDRDGLGTFKSTLLQSKGLTGSNAAQEANIMQPAFWETAKRHLLHSKTGLRFDELTNPDDKREWLEEAAAHYLGYVRDSNDRISDGDIIKHILPTLKANIKTELGADGVINNSAANAEVSANTEYGRASTIIGTIQNSKSGNLNFNAVFDSENGMIQSITAAKIEEGLSPTAARKEALGEFSDAVVFAYRNLGMEDDDYYHLMNELKFKHADGRMVSFSEMGGVWNDTQVALDRKLNEVNDERELIRLRGVFAEQKERYENSNGTVLISDRELAEYTGTELYDEVAKFKRESDNQFYNGTDGNRSTILEIETAVKGYVSTEFEGSTVQIQNRNIGYLKLEANKDFLETVQKLEKSNVDSAKARADAFTLVSDRIKEGYYNDALPNDEVDYDPGKILKKHVELISTDKQAWLDSKVFHIGEGKYAGEGKIQLELGGDLPILYANLAQYYPDYDARGLMVMRLKALGLIGNEYDAYIAPLEGKIDSMSRRNLTHNPTDAKTYFTTINSAKNFQGITEALLERPISVNMLANGGEDAIFTTTVPGQEGAYDNANLSKTNVLDLAESFVGLDDESLQGKLYGVYGIRGDNLKKLLTYMLENNIPMGDRSFDRKFQDELMLLNLALESQKKLTLNGDVSWLGLIPVSADESKDYEKLFAGIEDEDKDGNMWNEVRYLLKTAAQYKINSASDKYGYDKKEED